MCTDNTEADLDRAGMPVARRSFAALAGTGALMAALPARALAGKRAWITGLRREQSNARADVPLHEADGVHHGLAREKFNPLADWTWGDIWHFIQENAVPYNSLHDQFYPSIGCQPCTRAITLGEEFRAGRWWWRRNRPAAPAAPPAGRARSNAAGSAPRPARRARGPAPG